MNEIHCKVLLGSSLTCVRSATASFPTYTMTFSTWNCYNNSSSQQVCLWMNPTVAECEHLPNAKEFWSLARRSTFRLTSEATDVINGKDSCCNEPRRAKQRTHSDLHRDDKQVEMVTAAFLQPHTDRQTQSHTGDFNQNISLHLTDTSHYTASQLQLWLHCAPIKMPSSLLLQ